MKKLISIVSLIVSVILTVVGNMCHLYQYFGTPFALFYSQFDVSTSYGVYYPTDWLFYIGFVGLLACVLYIYSTYKSNNNEETNKDE